MKRLLQFGIAIKRGGASLQDRMDKERKPYIFVGLVCVREKYQRQGYMRKVLDIVFAEGDRLGVSVILETDARGKCDNMSIWVWNLPERTILAHLASCMT